MAGDSPPAHAQPSPSGRGQGEGAFESHAGLTGTPSPPTPLPEGEGRRAPLPGGEGSRHTIIGILSDSHGRVEATRRAVEALRNGGADLLIHLGDLETEEVLDELAVMPARVVFGNCDWDVAKLSRYAESLGIAVDHPAGRIDIDGRSVAFTHGHLERELERAVRESADYLLHGHTHLLRDERIGATRVINPGALFRAKAYTAALLTPATGALTIVTVSR